jgi:hypothetical protein
MSERKLTLVKSALKSKDSTKLSQAESTEAERFKALTAAKAARQAMIARIMAEVKDVDSQAA